VLLQVAVAFSPSALPNLGLRHAAAPALSANGRQRSALTLGNKRVGALALKAAVESATTAAKEKKAGRGVLGARPIGVGHAAPEVSITNKDMEKIVETTGGNSQSPPPLELTLSIDDNDDFGESSIAYYIYVSYYILHLYFYLSACLSVYRYIDRSIDLSICIYIYVYAYIYR
jgi:hypothetical protein